jgi:hypothetical protein
MGESLCRCVVCYADVMAIKRITLSVPEGTAKRIKSAAKRIKSAAKGKTHLSLGDRKR